MPFDQPVPLDPPAIDQPPPGRAQDGPPAAGPTPPRGGRLSTILAAIAADTARERISVADLVDVLRHRAHGALLFVFAVPNTIPTPPGTSAILGAPLLFLALQLMLGRKPWLPKVIASRSMARSDFARVVERIAPMLAKGERFLRPRLKPLAYPPGQNAAGAFCLLLSVVLFLPIPLGNMLPALAICLFGLGLLERDGLMILAGWVTGVASCVVVSGVVYALAKSALFLLHGAFG